MHYKNNAKMTYQGFSGKDIRFSSPCGRARLSKKMDKKALREKRKMLLGYIAKMK